ncbi:hypothetical protein K488DRAFT_56328 [Vararia minispora EC-137]|uniref:Uncharacterized protein n=1 Tax=Vararia minispora EC-137 TaxID=1314806 RepID=A0ACB8QDS6_9AGAM|nr:hypothetical protein K488DRAFT_56328 [Vararia minispora EC-137]
MALDDHVRRFHPVTLGLLTLFSIVELCITAWLQAHYNAHHNYPNLSTRDRTTFLLFASSWTIFFSLAFITLFMHSASTGSVLTSVASHFVIFFMTWVFWTAGAASITSALGGGIDCSNAGIPYCDQLMAEMAFAWICWAFVTIFLIAILGLGIRTIRRGSGYRGQLVSHTY